jgi:thymidylate synthase (FAD)
MLVIEPSYQIETPREWFGFATKLLERACRTCYKSEDKICEGSDLAILKKIMMTNPPHESVIEHFAVSVRFICDRGVSHELVRHRLASFSQESTRYCNYSKGKFGQITVIRPCFWTYGGENYKLWYDTCLRAEDSYFNMMASGAKPQEARTVLPNSLKTELVMTANLREWKTVFKQRTAPMAHPQMRQLMIPLLAEFQKLIPVIYDDIIPTTPN